MKLKIKLQYKSGRGKNGVIIFRRRGTKKKQIYRFVDFKMFLSRFIPYIILDSIYDPFRNNYLMFVLYLNGIYSYRILIDNVKIGSFFSYFSFFYDFYKKGNVCLLKDAPLGKEVCLISSRFDKSLFSRSAGAFGFVLKLDYKLKLALLKLTSGIKYMVSYYNFCVVGKINNYFFNNLYFGKAGKKRNLGYKQNVRGIARNPVDHPNGGRTPGGKVYRSFSFNIARSFKKTAKKNFSNIFISKIYLKRLLI